MSKIYAGPAKVFFKAKGLFPEGENGTVNAVINQDSDEIAVGMFGRVGEQQANAMATITLTPADNWGLLPILYPAYLGAKVGAVAAALAIGTQPHGAVKESCKIWAPADARLYDFVRAAVIRPPDIHLGVGKSLFSELTIGALGDLAKSLGDAGFLYTVTESAAPDPGGQFSMDDFVRGRWIGGWGDVAGFGGDSGDPMEAEDEWTISCEVKYQPLPVQKLVRGYMLTSVGYMVRVRPYGPTHSQIATAIGVNDGRTLGQRFGSAHDLTLEGPGGKTITLKGADVKGAGYEFGGTRLGTGEIGFVNEMKFAAGVPSALIEFSA